MKKANPYLRKANPILRNELLFIMDSGIPYYVLEINLHILKKSEMEFHIELPYGIPF